MLSEKVYEFIIEKKLIRENDRILVAFSGGVDSLALLMVLHGLKDRLKIEIGACHLNHMLRGKAADEDENFTRETCEKLGVPFYSVKRDVHAYGREKKLSLEAAGRALRYAFFKDIMVNMNYTRCATAHHLDDQVETILMNIMRGSGLNGLVGMSPLREGFIKPMLFLKKEELSSYLSGIHLQAREDGSNLESIYRRNKVRNELIPYIRENFNEDFPETLWRMSRLLSDDLDFLEETVEENVKTCLLYEQEEKVIILKEAFTLHGAICRRLIQKAILFIKGDLSDIEEKHIREIMALQHKETGKVVDIKDSVMARNDYGQIIIERKKTAERKERMLHEELTIPGTYKVLDKTITFRYVGRDEIIKDKRLRFFNGDIIEEKIIIRHRDEGDRMRPFGMNGYRKLKNILIDKKISREDRDTLLVFQNRNEIFYIGSMIISDDYKVKESTQKILEVGIFEEEKNDSR